jgi:2-oxoglutarate ferredoxin oxidoreductase subunit beta
LYLEHDQPLVFGKDRTKGIRLNGTRLEVIEFGEKFGPEDCLVWDETDLNPTIAFMVAQMKAPDFPTPIGVLRSVELPTYETGVVDQIQEHIDSRGQGTLQDLIYSGELWTVEDDGSITRGAGSS